MIFIPVQGGLGNQLFQWSMAHYIARETELKVVLVENQYFAHTSRVSPLFQLSDHCRHGIKLKQNQNVDFGYRIVDKLNKHNSILAKKVSERLRMFTLEDHESAKLPENISKNSSIRGFFQSTSMVKQVWNYVKEEIQSVMQASHDQSGKSAESEPFDFCRSYQSVHIRRGDYLENQSSLGVLSLEYFERLINPDHPTIICSDTLRLEEVLHWRVNCQLFNQHELTALETLNLLSNSKRLIMSNSTLSWWASQFVLDRGGEVIAPSPWFKESDMVSAQYLFDNRFSYVNSEFL